MSRKNFEEIISLKPYIQNYFELYPRSEYTRKLIKIEQKDEYYIKCNEKALASSVSPKIQANRLLQDVKIKEKDIVFVMGLGNPHVLELVNQTTRSGQIIIFIDDSLEMIEELWTNFWANILLVSGRHVFCGTEFLGLLFNYLEPLSIQNISGVKFIRNIGSTNTNREFYLDVEQRIQKMFSSKLSDLLTRFEFERIWVKNSLVNAVHFYDENPKRFRVKDLEGKFLDTPALLVSAGPSLRENCEWIKKIRDKVFVLTCDTSVKVLLKFGIIPDGIVTLDAQTHSYFHFMGEDISKIPIFGDMVTSPALIRNLNFGSLVHSMTAKYQTDASGKSIIEMTAGGETVTELLGYVGNIQSGGSVATTAFDLLRFLGFQKIFLIGQDLAYSGREIHSTGTHHNEKWLTKVNRKTSLEKINEQIVRLRQTKYVPSCNGQTVLTDYILELYRQWFEASCYKIDIDVYNINEKGAFIENVKNISAQKSDEILSNIKNHNYYWKEYDPWKKNITEIKKTITSFSYKEILFELESIVSKISKLEKSNFSEEQIDALKKDIQKIHYIRPLLKKSELYLRKHDAKLDEDRKKSIFLSNLIKEVQFLKRGLLANS